jgi:hypothetical protein
MYMRRGETNMKKAILSAIVLICVSAAGFAGNFNLNTISVSDLKGSGNDGVAVIPAPFAAVSGLTKAPNLAPGMDMSVKLPFKDLNKRMNGLCDEMKVIDPAAPVLSRQGDHIVFTNVTVNYHGIMIEPTVLMQPQFEADNRLVMKFLRADMDIAFGPKSMNAINKDELTASVIDSLASSITKSMDEAFAANKVALRAKDVLFFTYNKASWTLRAAVTPNFVAPLMPGLLENLTLTSFAFDDAGFTMSVKSGSAAAIKQLPGYNLALSDGLLTRFIRKFAEGSTFDLAPAGHDGGIKFRADGRVEIAGKTVASTAPLKPTVYFTAEVSAALTGPNTLTLTFVKMTVDKAYGIPLPGFVGGWLQGTAISSTMTTITTDPDLAKVMTARKLNDNTVEVTLKPCAFMPSFAKGVTVKNMKIGQGLMYLGFEF